MKKGDDLDNYLKPTYFMDYNHPIVKETLDRIPEARNGADLPAKMKALFYFVRDEIEYTDLLGLCKRKEMKASSILKSGKAFCVQKAVVLCALLRALGIPAALHFADIINHRLTEKAVEILGTKMIVYHGYTEAFNGKKWIAMTPVFDKKTCKERGYPPIEFDGLHDAKFPAYTESGEKFMEYIKDRGRFEDLPYGEMVSAWAVTYAHSVKKVLGKK